MQKIKDNFTNQKGIAHLLLILLILALIAGGVYYYLNSTNKEILENLQLPSGKKEIVVASTAQVGITSKGFMPQTIKVKKGVQIIWTNTDKSAHKVSSDPHPTHTNLAGLNSPTLLANQTYSYIFETAGTYTYHDHLNPFKFKGIVVVE